MIETLEPKGVSVTDSEWPAWFFVEEQHGPLPFFLHALTIVTGLVDAVSYLRLGHVFVANMTGNVVFLGFAVTDHLNFSIPASLTALAAFLVGSLAGGRLGTMFGRHRGRLLAIVTSAQVGLVGIALFVSLLGAALSDGTVQYGLIVLLGGTMGLQNATARRLGVPDMTTTVLTLTLTGLAADSIGAGGTNPRPVRRMTAVVLMFIGAAAGAWLLSISTVAVVLSVTLAVLALVCAGTLRTRHSSASWTR
ncbi:YoaK family protein [Mesorhizobium sp.]|uniref:YoaK family protein n=1 Tax=Mesorhizobium sp. TaxID=1871066 RepID=UPI0025FFB90B|nr:YoaK family protein [Mesorhizobium sp.]